MQRSDARSGWPCLVAGLGALWMSTAALGLELVVVETRDCGPCDLFDRQIASIYSKTDVAQRLPMTRVALADYRKTGLTFRGPIDRAPTFVIVEDRVEQQRFEGYASDELFWMTLESLVPAQ